MKAVSVERIKGQNAIDLASENHHNKQTETMTAFALSLFQRMIDDRTELRTSMIKMLEQQVILRGKLMKMIVAGVIAKGKDFSFSEASEVVNSVLKNWQAQRE